MHRTQGTRLERNATDYCTRAEEEIGARLYPSKISVMQSGLCATNQGRLCCRNPCIPARPHQTKRSHSVAHHLKRDASVRDLCLLLHINLPRPPPSISSPLPACASRPTTHPRGQVTCATETKRVISLPYSDTPLCAGSLPYLPRLASVSCVVALTSWTSHPTTTPRLFLKLFPPSIHPRAAISRQPRLLPSSNEESDHHAATAASSDFGATLCHLLISVIHESRHLFINNTSSLAITYLSDSNLPYQFSLLFSSISNLLTQHTSFRFSSVTRSPPARIDHELEVVWCYRWPSPI